MLKNTHQSPLGQMTMLSDGEHLVGLWFTGQKYYGAKYDLGSVPVGNDKVITATQQWLAAYFNGDHPAAQQIPLAPETTEFRQQVYQALQDVPYGQTTTYQMLSNCLQEGETKQKNLARAVGNAIGHNPILLLIPCHRVIGSDGSLTGYAGGLSRKKALLALEQGDPHPWNDFIDE